MKALHVRRVILASLLTPNEFAEDRRHALIFGFTFGEGVQGIDVGEQQIALRVDHGLRRRRARPNDWNGRYRHI